MGGQKQKKPKEERVMDMISAFRAEVCADMKDENGKDFETYEECKEFMMKTCKPGKDELMDGDSKEVTSQHGFCQEYFPKAEKKAKEKVEKEIEEEKKEYVVVAGPAPSPGSGPGPAPAPAPAPQQAAPAPAPVGASPAPAPTAPAPAPMGSPGPAPGPVPAPFVPGVSAGKPWGAIKDDESYYFAKGGKDPARLHMNADMKIPEHGYWGKLVEHNDGTTFTDDWGKEFGPPSGHDSYRAICAHHPENPWCRQNGYHHKSSCTATFASLLPLVCAFAATRFL